MVVAGGWWCGAVRTVFLFSDVFLLAKHIPASGVYHLKFMIYLNPSVHVEHNPYVKGTNTPPHISALRVE
jgi:hypothetical protein